MRCGKVGDFFEIAEPDLLGFDSQTAALPVRESGLLTQDFLQNFDCLLQIVDRVLLLSVDPAHKAEENERQWIHWGGFYGFRARKRRRMGKREESEATLNQEIANESSFSTLRQRTLRRPLLVSGPVGPAIGRGIGRRPGKAMSA